MEMILRDHRHGWQLTATSQHTAEGFISVGSALRDDASAESAPVEFERLAGPFQTETAAVLAALHGLREWSGSVGRLT